MKNQKQEKEKIHYETIIAGALLKFEEIDNVDFSLLIEDFENKTNIKVVGLWQISPNELRKYFNFFKNGTIKLSEEVSLDDFIEEDNCTLREKLQKVSGKVVNDYFNNLDIKKYYQEKDNSLSNYKKAILDKANILLISDIQDDYDELIKYGFKNVDYFKSIIRADNYFSKNPETLQKYQIILKGNQNVQHCDFGWVELDRKIRELGHRSHVLKTSLYKRYYGEYFELEAYLNDDINCRSWETIERTYEAIFDRIVENALINHTLFLPIKDYINPNRLPLPAKKSDLKILYLDRISVSKYANDIAKQLGLDITFIEDGNFSLGKNVKTHLGDYDIIIASNSYSRKLLEMNFESTEQCKDTGRDLTLLVTYDNDSICLFDEDNEYDSQGIGDKIILKYKFGGNFAVDSKLHDKVFRVLRKSADFISEDEEHCRNYFESEVTCMTGIISASINVYNEALFQMNKTPISDLDIKTAEEFDKEYEVEDIKEENRKEAALAPIKCFDSIRDTIMNYLYYRKEGLIFQSLEGLNIIENKNSIRVENIDNRQINCTISFKKIYNQNNFRVLKIQTLSEKGKLSDHKKIGLYTRKYEILENVPKRPNDEQAIALLSIYNKINSDLLPLNNEAFRKKLELDKQKRFVLEKKKRI